MANKPYKTGLVIGRFNPPHKGHSFLIDAALAQSQRVAVIVCETKGEVIPASTRALWLQEIHPTSEVFVADDHVSDGDHAGWASYVRDILGYTPEALFTSESYGDLYAKVLGSKHVMVDRQRQSVPISATEVARHPSKHFAHLHPQVRAHFEKNIFSGVVGQGDSYATKLGFPTINIPLPDTTTSGIYAGRVVTPTGTYKAAVYSNQKRHILEAHLFDFEGSLYGQSVTIELIGKVRDDHTFADEASLKHAIAQDITNIREYLKD